MSQESPETKKPVGEQEKPLPAPPKLEAAHGSGVLEKEAQAEYDKGQGFYRQFQFKQAAEYFQRAVSRADDPAYYLSLGNSLFQMDRLDDALKSLESALKSAQQKGNKKVEGDTMNSMGLIYKTLGKYDQALDCYQKSLKIRQDLGDLAGEAASKYNIACVYAEQGQEDKAVDLIKDVATIEQMMRMVDGTNLVPLEKVFHCSTQSRSY